MRRRRCVVRADRRSRFAAFSPPSGSRRQAGQASSLETVLLVAAGGVLGTLARYGLLRAWPAPAAAFPWAVLVVNTTGSLALAALLAWAMASPSAARRARLALGTGVLGAYTTFSTYAVGVVQLVRAHRYVLASAYLVASLGAGLMAAAVGLLLARHALAVARTRAGRERSPTPEGSPELASVAAVNPAEVQA